MSNRVNYPLNPDTSSFVYILGYKKYYNTLYSVVLLTVQQYTAIDSNFFFT